MAALVAGAAPLIDAAPLERVQQTGALRLCAHPAAPPYSSRSRPDGRPGLQVELAEAVAGELTLGLTVVWAPAPSVDRKFDCDALMDMIVLRSAAPHAREGRIGPLKPTVLPVRFTKPYAESGVFLAVPAGASARRFEDLAEQKIGVVVGSLEHAVLANKGLKVSAYAFQDEIVAAVDAGEIGAGAVAAAAVAWYRHEHPDATVTIPAGYDPEPEFRWNIAIGLWRADDALVEAVNAALDRVMDKRIPEQIYAKYGVAYRPPRPALE